MFVYLQVLLLLISALHLSQASPINHGHSPLAPLHIPPVASNDLINDSYIVIFREDIHPSTFSAHLAFLDYASETHPLHYEDDNTGGVVRVYDSIVAKGYAGLFSSEAIAMIRTRPEVKFIEQNQVVRPDNIQFNPPWGLARINHRDQPAVNHNHYIYDNRAGYGAIVYVIDTGIYVGHNDFNGRATWGTTFYPHEGYVDTMGHGTHVAGTIASMTYGVAKHAHVRAVKVFAKGLPGDNSIIISAIQWAVQDAFRYAEQNRPYFKGAVINLSLGGGPSRALDDAATSAVYAGLHVVVSAGNDNADACYYSPAAAILPITVGATTVYDQNAGYSNWGMCVDVLAPGTGIISTWINGPLSAQILDGTSMAAPHVSGLIAYFIST